MNNKNVYLLKHFDKWLCHSDNLFSVFPETIIEHKSNDFHAFNGSASSRGHPLGSYYPPSYTRMDFQRAAKDWTFSCSKFRVQKFSRSSRPTFSHFHKKL
jgi:hypothetical protein